VRPYILRSYRGSCRANLGQFQAAIRDLDVYVEARPDDAQGWYNRGLCHRYLRDNQQALADYTRAIEQKPDFTWALINRGNVQIDLKQFDLALADYNAALAFGEIPRAYTWAREMPIEGLSGMTTL
jgi:tetratricopeptide (TPR) repeat protein